MNDSAIDPFAMAAVMGAGLPSTNGPVYVEAPDGTRFAFLERSNAAHEDAASATTSMTFSGRFMLDGALVQTTDGSPADGGFGATFEEAGDPTSAWLWLANPVDDEARDALEAVFGETFDETGLRMDIAPEAFLQLSDSSSWDAYLEDDEDEPLFD